MNEKINLKIIESGILSFLLVLGLTRNYIVKTGPLIQSNSIFTFILFFVFLYALYYCLKNINKKEILVSVPSGLILAICQRIGSEFSVTGHINFQSISLYYSIFALFILFSLLISLFMHFRKNMLKIIKNFSINKYLQLFFENKLSFWLIFILLMLFWLPAFLAVFPGIYSYDAGPQVLQVYGGQGLSAHHPVVHTLLLNGCFFLGNLLFKNYNLGLMIYTIVQSIIMAMCFSYVINKLKVFHVTYFVRLLGLLFFAISPIIQIWVMLTTKDTIFAGLFVVVFVDILELVLYPENIINSNFKISILIIKIILMCLFRNQGIYVFIFIVPFLLFIMREYWKKMIILLLIPILCVEILLGPVSTYFNIKPANPREALSVPIQQIARVLNLAPESVSEENLEIINRYLPSENIIQYNPYTSDYVKEGFNAEYFEKDKLSFFKVWFELFLEEPQIYLESFLYGSYGYFYSDDTPYWITYILFDGAWMDDFYNVLNIERNSLFSQYEQYLRKVSNEIILDKVPVISTISSQAFPFIMLVVLFAFVLYEKKYRILVPLLLIFGFWGTMLLGPLIAIRYAFPIIVCVPVMLSILFFDNKEINGYNKKKYKSDKGR